MDKIYREFHDKSCYNISTVMYVRIRAATNDCFENLMNLSLPNITHSHVLDLDHDVPFL